MTSAAIIGLVLQYGPIAILVLVVVFVATNPEKTEKLAGWFLGLFNFGIRTLRQKSIKSSIQGRINDFARSMNKQVTGIMPYNIRLQFIKDVDRAELSPDKQLVIVRIRDRQDDDRNLVHSMMVFCSIGVIPQARRFLSKSMSAAIDVTVTRKLLNTLKHHSALQYLYDEVMSEGEKEDIRKREDFCKTFDTLDESGLFTRVVLEEMRDFGARIESQYPQPIHGIEATQFVEYVHDVATRQPGQVMPEIGHKGTYIATAFVFVGTADTMTAAGEAPYISHIKRLCNIGYQKAYLAARGWPRISSLRAMYLSTSGQLDKMPESTSVNMAKQVSQSIHEAGIGTVGRTMEYYASDSIGNERKHILIELYLNQPSE